jgi:hypothetical protein
VGAEHRNSAVLVSLASYGALLDRGPPEPDEPFDDVLEMAMLNRSTGSSVAGRPRLF